MAEASIKVGMIAEQTGALAFMGGANANVATMVVDDLNASGGLLGRPIELFLEDGATTDLVAAAAAATLVERDKVDVIFGGIYSSTRQAIKGAAVEKGGTLYIYPEQYEGQESHPLIFCTGPVPAQQLDPFIPWLMRTTGSRTFYLPSSDYIWPHVMNQKVRRLVMAEGGTVVGEEYFAMDAVEFGDAVDKIMSSGAEVVFNTIVPPGVAPFLQRLQDAGFRTRGGQLICTYFDENLLGLLPSEHVEGLYGCLDFYQTVDDPFSQSLLGEYNKRFPGKEQFTGGSGCSGLYRGMMLWAAAVKEAGALDQDKVIAALDHAKIGDGPGGPAEMAPGQHHVRMNMYIARAKGGRFEIVKALGAIDPQEAIVRSDAAGM
ncbi:substrate-binding protein [Alsobacter sp. KACC 23698]|uniref:Substrate-binding protein n=1 Tax=Alsobacter sp. KACC 23698 TaxID=3149229 RepID=A0AAU7JIR8_9HYPH